MFLLYSKLKLKGKTMRWSNCSFSEIGTMFCEVENRVYEKMNEDGGSKYFIKEHRICKKEKKGVITIWNRDKMNLGGCKEEYYAQYHITGTQKEGFAFIRCCDTEGNQVFYLEIVK